MAEAVDFFSKTKVPTGFHEKCEQIKEFCASKSEKQDQSFVLVTVSK